MKPILKTDVDDDKQCCAQQINDATVTAWRRQIPTLGQQCWKSQRAGNNYKRSDAVYVLDHPFELITFHDFIQIIHIHHPNVWTAAFKLSVCLDWLLLQGERKQSHVTRLTLLSGQRLMNDYFSLPAGIAHSPVARRVKATQFRADKSQGDNMLWFNQRWTDYGWQGKHNQEELVYWSF